MHVPQTRYAKSGGLNIAYQTFGSGPDLTVALGWVSNVDQIWDLPGSAEFLTELARSFRVTIFDKRGTGLSDRTVGYPTLDDRMDDLRAVMDDAGIGRTMLLGVSEGGGMVMLFAATYPERTRHLVLFGTFACRERKPDYPWAPSPEERQGFYDRIETQWGGDMDLSVIAPSLVGDREAADRLARYFRSGASPQAALLIAKLNTAIDVRHVLPTIRVPTLVLHRKGDRDSNIAEARYIASQIPNARLVELDGDDHVPFVGDTKPVLDALRSLVEAGESADDDARVLATVLFTDIVDSTKRLRESGDAKWRELLARHNEMTERIVRQGRGTLVKTTGDGALAHFDRPARAARCGLAIVAEAGEMGLGLRAAVHTCEIEQLGDDIVGVGVHLASRAMGLAGPGELLATETVKALVSGSGLRFEAVGEHVLKGFDEPVAVYRVGEQ